jgi:thioredoxin 1
MIVISDSEFQTEVLEAEQPVLVYFWAPWCGPCRLVSPLMESIDTTYGDRLKVVKMEIDPNPETVKEYKVQGVPALLLFKQGSMEKFIEGAVTKATLTAMLDEQL